MAECNKPVGSGVVAYPCIIEVDGGPHAGPCAARENIRSMNERSKWESARERAAKSGVPTLEDLGMQGAPKTVIEGLLDRESGEGRRIHPDELRRIKDGMDTSHTEEASLETRLVQTAGAVDISGVSSEVYKTFRDDMDEVADPGLREGDQPLPTPNDNAHVHDLVILDFAERKNIGTIRYGTPLQAFNGRSALRDAYEEVLDLTAYLRQVMLEHEVAALALYELGGLLDNCFGGNTPPEVQDLLSQIASALD